ncbi:type II CAAX endopeptidase family protein [Pedobacter sp. JY14-1]|uniref:type II CAAX endopeptidase family protein n=1 Tax=Pedobacter sp. JY14-1 TaxID=3034151 RepID=UPI0023E17212|nr:type II CAAX endopeptidase family protein [Pedobacter sp. JY14-1]
MNTQTKLHQLIIYFTLAYLISWIIWFPLYSPAFGVNGLPVLPLHHGIGGLGPMIASLICTRVFEGEQGLKILVRQMGKFKPMLYVAIALLAPFLLAGIAAVINQLLNHHPVELPGLFVAKEFPEFNFIGFLLYNLLFFGFGEEVGWRGFALPRLQARYNALWSSLVLTFFWALWHWPLFLYRPGFIDMGIAGTFGWIFSLLTGSVLLTWLYNSSKASILVCAIFHSTIDIAFLADFTDQNIINYMGMLITVWGIATIMIFKPKNLSTTEKIKL